MQVHEFIVEELKTRLDRYLAARLPQISRSQIQRDIESGYVEVNEAVIAESKFVVTLNDKIVYRQRVSESANPLISETNTPLEILYNNHGLIIINKPAGLVVHPGAGFKGETLASALLYQFKDIRLVGEDHRPGIVHRLDKDTSGVILVARTQEMYEYLKDAFAERKVKKEYIALVYGKVEKQHGFIETPMGKSKSDFRKQTVKDPVEAKEAVTEYKVLEYLHTQKSENRKNQIDRISQPPILRFSDQSDSSDLDTYTLILVKLHTGRTHQIRVDLSSIGHPLMGDELYGGKRIYLEGLKRQFLHAKKIEVQLPDKTWIEAESELAEDLKEVLENLNSKTVKTL